MTGRRDLGRRSGSAAPGGVRAHHRRDVPVGLALSVRLRRDSRSRSQPRCALRSPPASGRPRAAGRRAGRRHQPGRRGWIGLRWNGQEFPGAVETIQQDAVRVLAERDPPRRMGRPRPATSNGRGTPGQSPRSTVVRMKRPRVCGAVSSGGSSVGKPRVRGHQAPSNCPWGCGAGPAREWSGIGRAGGQPGPRPGWVARSPSSRQADADAGVRGVVAEARGPPPPHRAHRASADRPGADRRARRDAVVSSVAQVRGH